MGGEDTVGFEATRDRVFAGFKAHFNGHRASTEATMLEFIRKAYPDFNVIITSPDSCDLFGYSKAGHAAATMDQDERFDATRLYESPGPRLEGKPGTLENHVRFGRWTYVWKSYEYILYEVEYVEDRMQKKLYFVLHPRATEAGDNPIDDLLLAAGEWSTALHDEIYVFDNSYWAKSRQLWKSVQSSTWDEVILNENTKASLIEDVQGFFNSRSLYQSYAVPWKRGLILHGLPGNGKTISIKALINALGARSDPVPSLYVKSLDACVGRTAKYSIRQIFSRARRMAPCLLIFEDIDSLITAESRSYFLNEVDGLESNEGILMIGSTNHLEKLDPAISKRPSRFDRKYHFKLPDLHERTLYCEFWRKKVALNNTVDFPAELCHTIAKLSEGFSFAYLKELFVISLLVIARGGKGEEPEAVADETKEDDAKSSSDSDGVIVDTPRNSKASASKKKEDQSTNTLTGTINLSAFPVITVSFPNQGIAAVRPSALAKKEKKKKLEMPVVETPEHLRDNVLLKVVRQQLKMLLDEMDSTETKEKGDKIDDGDDSDED